MGGKAEVEVQVMYPGFKFGEGDHVVEVAKKAAAKIGRSVNYYIVVVEVMQTSLQALIFQL